MLWQGSLTLEHYKSDESRRVARLSVEGFVAWLSSRGLNICNATAEHVDEYVNNVLAGKAFSQRTLKRAAGTFTTS
jgi:site-specific recombinase XerD